MYDRPSTILCPDCQMPINHLDLFCPGCGFKEPVEFQNDKSIDLQTKLAKESWRKGAGPFSFALPPAQNAYVFHPAEKATPEAIYKMLGVGLAIAIPGGALLYLLHILVAAILSILLSSSCLFFFGLLLYPLAAVLIGLLIGKGIEKVAIKTLCRSPRYAKIISLVCGLVGFGVYLVVYFSVLGFQEGFDSFIDFLKLGSYLVAIPGTAWATSTISIESTPYCETCSQYMHAVFWGKPGVNGWPIKLESELLSSALAKDFQTMMTHPLEKSKPLFNNVRGILWYCPECQDEGYFNLETTQVRRKVEGNKEKIDSKTQLIFSSKLQKEDIEYLLSMSAIHDQYSAMPTL